MSEVPDDIADKVLLESAYSCGLCHKHESFVSIQIHHIDEDDKNHDPDNLMSICVGCHMGKIHITTRYGRKMKEEIQKKLRDEWYESVRYNRDKMAEGSVIELMQTEQTTNPIDFNVSFNINEINIGEKIHLIFKIINNSDKKIEILNYQGEVYYIFESRLIPHIKFGRHYWDLEQKEIPGHEELTKEWGDEDPTTAYLISRHHGEWIVRFYIDYTDDRRFIKTISSDASLKIK